MKNILSKLSYIICLGIFIGLNTANILQAADEYQINISVAPNVINLQSYGYLVTVHTEIPYSIVDGVSVTLNGVVINAWKADSRGNFVARFLMNEIEKDAGFQIGDYNTLKLSGLTIDNKIFWGVDEVMVVDNKPGTAQHGQGNNSHSNQYGQFTHADRPYYCGTVDNQINLTLPCIIVDNYIIKATFHRVNHPRHGGGLLWRLNTAAINFDAVNGPECTTIDKYLNMHINSVRAAGSEYKVKLNFYHHQQDKLHLFWEFAGVAE